jgi:hypothetical protein
VTTRASSLIGVGEVLAHPRAEVPDTTISTPRFLEAEGLVEPRRTPTGYRTYGWDDVALRGSGSPPGATGTCRCR